MANGNGNDYGPSYRLAKLYRKQSKSGATYFSGRLGFARATLLKSKEVGDDGAEIWNLVISEAPQAKQEERPSLASPELKAQQSASGSARRDDRRYVERELDDSVPF